MKKKLLYLTLTIIITIGGSLAYLFLRPSSERLTSQEGPIQFTEYTDEVHGISIKYPMDAQKETLSEDDNRDLFILRIGKTDNRPYLISLRYEEGLKIASQLAKTNTLDLLVNNATKVFPLRFSEYREIAKRTYQIRGKNAAELIFEYSGPSGEVVRQTLVIIVENEDKAYYLALQSRATDVDSLDSTFTAVKDSIKVK